MKYLSLVVMLLSGYCVMAQTASNNKHPQIFKMAPAAPGLDSYAVKQYYFVMLVEGPKRKEITDPKEIEKLQAGHMANIGRLAKEGKLMLAGPFGDDTKWRGLFVFDCETKEEVEQLLATDPMIKAGRLGYEIHPWWTGMNSVFK